jgi:hypothetical protein
MATVLPGSFVPRQEDRCNWCDDAQCSLRRGEGGVSPRSAKTEGSRWKARLGIGAGAVVLLVGAAMALAWLLGRPSVSVTQSGSALFHVRLAGLGTESTGVEATSAGRTLTLTSRDGGLVPTTRLAQGQSVVVHAGATAPSWLRWLLGGTVSTTRTVHAPAVTVSTKVAVSSNSGRVPVGFDRPVTVIDYRSTGGSTVVLDLR